MLKIIKLLGLKHEIDSKIFRKALYQYPFNSESSGSYLLNITDVRAYKKSNTITVVIVTHTPGILIGKAGRTINGIKELMSKMSGCNVQVDIRESDLFTNLYY